ncbi:ABC transporter permease [Leadbettera azotonutricia]|uniref:Transport permease protein n=1 Tax=Leadbettera azotonutricia (strain ATCC BAA-888 / DSM 13862 / ZAS-9) TaxID=545695 RepID=F5YAL7_LEAAZ|nr:ABC transporter permease [Leadbettera azotonutricia]AEF81459.1 ABC transporter family protein [Leadbettera azotonutricia ZAS-9]
MNAVALNPIPMTMPKVLRELNAIITIVCRDVFLAVKSPPKIFMAILMPVMMLGMFGSQLSQNMGINMGFNFNQFMLVGMLVNGLFMITMMGITSLVEDRETDFTQEILVAPVSRYSIIFGKIIGASVMSYIQFFATLIVGLCIGATLSTKELLMLFAVSPLMCLAAGSLAVVCIGFIHKSTTANFVVMMLSMAQMFLSGAMIPINNSKGLMAVLSRLLPMTYCIDFARGMFYQNTGETVNVTLYPPAVNLIIIASFTAVFFISGTIAFVHAETNK